MILYPTLIIDCQWNQRLVEIHVKETTSQLDMKMYVTLVRASSSRSASQLGIQDLQLLPLKMKTSLTQLVLLLILIEKLTLYAYMQLKSADLLWGTCGADIFCHPE